jgi:hypothetical protein
MPTIEQYEHLTADNDKMLNIRSQNPGGKSKTIYALAAHCQQIAHDRV